MIGRLAVRSLTAHPIRSAVLAAGFGVGVAVMAILLGVAEVILQQAQAPALAGGGDVIVRLSRQVPAQLLLSGTLQADALRPRVRVASPSHVTDLFLLNGGRITRVEARGGIPSLERALGDPETAGIGAWRDAPADLAWVDQSPEGVLRRIDRFHPIPDAPRWASSWAEWLYFNGRAQDARFYLSFRAGPRLASGDRAAAVRLQLERDGRTETFSAAATIGDDDLKNAPDLAIGGSSVQLDGMRYRIRLDLPGDGGRRARGELTIHASPGTLVPPIEIAGAHGWLTGYVVPVTSGRLDGEVVVDDPRSRRAERVSLDGGTGYHDHNWGFWEDVTWQWGQVQHEDVSFIYGHVFPPAEAADPDRLPGFVGALGPEGPIGYATDVRIAEENDERGRPRTITIRAVGPAVDVTLRFVVDTAVSNRMDQGPAGGGVEFVQLRGIYTVKGRAGSRTFDFTAPGAAETFRGRRGASPPG